jgi:hypothetical protein
MTEVIPFKIWDRYGIRKSYYQKMFPKVKRVFVTDCYLDESDGVVDVTGMCYSESDIELEEIYYRRATTERTPYKIYVKVGDYEKFKEQMEKVRRKYALKSMISDLQNRGIDYSLLLDESKSLEELRKIYDNILKYKNII